MAKDSIHRAASGYFVISTDEVWRPGAYADERAARFAFQFTDSQLQELMDRCKPAPITFEMLQQLGSSEKG